MSKIRGPGGVHVASEYQDGIARIQEGSAFGQETKTGEGVTLWWLLDLRRGFRCLDASGVCQDAVCCAVLPIIAASLGPCGVLAYSRPALWRGESRRL